MVLLRCLRGGEEQQDGRTRARTHEELPARASTAKLLWCVRNVLCVVHARLLAACDRGQLLLTCVVMSRGFCVAMLVVLRGPHNQRARKPPAPLRVAFLAELSCHGACEMFLFAWKREFVS